MARRITVVNESMEKDSVLVNLDNQLSVELEFIQDLYKIQYSHFQLQKDFANKKTAESDKITYLESRIARYAEIIKSIDLDKAHTGRKTDPFEPSTWRIEGRVTSQGIGIQDMIVFISPEKKVTVTDQLSSSTDAMGFYSITVNKELLVKLKDSASHYLYISGKNKKVIRKEEEPLIVAASKIDIINVVLTDKEYKPATVRSR